MKAVARNLRKRKFAARLISRSSLEDMAIERELADLRISSWKSIRANRAIIINECNRLEEVLRAQLGGANQGIDIARYHSCLDEVINNSDADFALVCDKILRSDIREMARRVVNLIKKISAENPHDARGVFQSLLKYESEHRNPFYGEEMEAAYSAIVDMAFKRTIMFVSSAIEAAKDLDADTVNPSLRRFYLLRQAHTMMFPKLVDEGNDLITRFVQKLLGDYPM